MRKREDGPSYTAYSMFGPGYRLEQPQFSLGFREREGEERTTKCLTIGVGTLTRSSFGSTAGWQISCGLKLYHPGA